MFDDPVERDAAFPEKYLAGRVRSPDGPVDVHVAHLPPGVTRGIVKVHAFEAIRRRVDEPTDFPVVLCGDFNSPKSESGGRIVTWAENHRAHFERWDAAERGVICHPHLRDAFRELHGYEPQPASWTANYRGQQIARRFDHIFVSADLIAASCDYLHSWRTEALSDHSAIEATFERRADDVARSRTGSRHL